MVDVHALAAKLRKASKRPFLLLPFAEGVELSMEPGTRLRPDEIRALRADLAGWLTERGYPLEEGGK